MSALLGARYYLMPSERALAQPRPLVLEFQRRDADQLEARVVQLVAGLHRADDRRDRRPEMLIEKPAEIEATRIVQPLDLPTIHRPVSQRIALHRRLAEGLLPGIGVGLVEVEQDTVGVQGNQGTRHRRNFTSGR